MTFHDVVFESLPLPAIIHDESAIIDINRAACAALEADDPDELVGLTLGALIHSDAREAGRVPRGFLKDGHRFSGIATKLVTRKRKTLPALVAAIPFRIGDRLMSIVIAGDVDCPGGTGGMAIAEYPNDMPIRQAALDVLPLPVLLNVAGTTIEYVNPATCRLLKANDHCDLVGRSTVEIAHPDMHELVHTRVKLQVVGAAPDEAQAVKLQAFDGTEIRATLQGHFIQKHGKTYGVWAVTSTE